MKATARWAGFGSRQGFLVVTEFPCSASRQGSPMSRPGFQVVCNYYVATVFCFSVVTMSLQRFPCYDLDGHDKRSSVATGLALDMDFMSRHSVFMSRRSSVKAKGFYVVTENFHVATKFLGVVSQQSILCRDKVWSRPRDFMSRQRIRCHYKVA